MCSYRGKISFKLKFNIKTWLKTLKNRYHERQIHVNETNEQLMQRLASDRNQRDVYEFYRN
jgi:hypothetical protein